MSATRRPVNPTVKRRGGARPGAGRKPKGDVAGMPHLRREALKPRFPVHITLALLDHVPNLRSRRSFSVIEKAFWLGHDRNGFRLIEFSVQASQLQLIVEADDQIALARGMQGLTIRLAKGLNRLLGRKGPVFADRYHARILKSPTQVKEAVEQVLDAHRRHEAERGKQLPRSWHDPYSSAVVSSAGSRPVIAPAQTSWLQAAARRR